MKRTWNPLVPGVVLAALLAAAAPGLHAQQAAPAPEAAALRAQLEAMSGEQLGTLTVGDLLKLADRISVSEQEARYVQRARIASRFLPGAGQLMTGDPVGGALFLGGDLLLAAGTLVSAYFLLPSNVQFSSLDYLNAPISTIHSQWESNSIASYLPSFAVCLGGMVLQHVLGHFASIEAAKSARRAVAEGKVTFTPSFEFLGRPGMGFRMRY